MNIDKYLADFKFIGSTIRKMKIKNDFVSIDNSNNFKRTIDVSHTIDSIGTDNEGSLLLGVIIVNIKVVISSNKKKLVLDMSIEGCFEIPAEVGEEVFRKMLQVNGVTSLYSISRGFVQSTTSQILHTGSVLLPMFNVVAYSKDLDAENTNK